MVDLDDEWSSFCDNSDEYMLPIDNPAYLTETKNICDDIPRQITPLYISTQTVITRLNVPKVDLNSIFWKIPLIKYHEQKEGFIKKQIKFNSATKEEVEYINEMKKQYTFIDETIINHIDNPSGKVQFKDVRKVSIGISRKDIVSLRRKKKGAFYNCFVLIMRLNVEGTFKEFHIKLFNTGKIEIPGIQNTNVLDKVFAFLVAELILFIPEISHQYITSNTYVVLINSNFNCGYYLNRSALNNLFKHKYNSKIRSNYDPCTYPGIQCSIYIDGTTKVSFMVFRTGSVLIVGKCSEKMLHEIYDYLSSIFTTEYNIIQDKPDICVQSPDVHKIKIKKTKTITIHV